MTPALISALKSLEDVRDVEWVEVSEIEDESPKLGWEDKDPHDLSVVHAALCSFAASSDLSMEDEACAGYLIHYLARGVAPTVKPA